MGSQLLEICQYLQVEHADGPIPDLSAATAVMVLSNSLPVDL